MNTLTIRDLSKDEICQSALKELTARGARVRKVHNVAAYKKRRFQVQKGWCDISGYGPSAVHLECEVKTKGDRFSNEQIERLNDLEACGGIALVATQIGNEVKILPWKEAKTIYNL